MRGLENSTDMPSLADWELEFLTAPDIGVVMQMPGCLDVFTNLSHSRIFTGSFATPESPLDCTILLENPRHEYCKTDVCLETERCYCEKTKAMLALSNEFCAFEDLYGKLKESAGDWLTGICFLRMRSAALSREYDVFRVHVRRLPGAFGDRFLEARLLQLGDMSLKATITQLNQDGYTAQRLQISVKLGGSEWLKPREYDVPLDAGYKEFGAALVEGRKNLLKGQPTDVVRKDILHRIRPLKYEYQPVENFTCCLFSAASPSEIVVRLENVLNSLNDALVVVKDVKPLLERKLSEEVFVNSCAGVPIDLQFKLFRARIPYGQLKETEASIYNAASISIEHPLGENLALPANTTGKQQDENEGDRTMLSSITKEQEITYLEDFRREAAAFERLLPELLKKFPNEYVAIFQGEVIGHRGSWEDLTESLYEVYEQFPDRPILLEKVVEPTNIAVHMDARGT